MAPRRPPVAILVPTYNGGRFLGETLASVEAQTYRNLRILIRDDGSTDDSLEIAKSFADRDHRFTIVPGGERAGAAANCTTLVGSASEPFLKLLMQDDLLHPRHVEKLVAPMIDDPEVTLASSARQLVDANGDLLPAEAYNVPLVERATTLDGRSVTRHLLLGRLNRIGEPSTTIIRNGSFDAARPFAFAGRDYAAMSDVAMWLTLLTSGRLYYDGEALSSFRQHRTQRSQDLSVHIQCVQEWARLFEGAVRTGLLDIDEEVVVAARAMVDWNQQMIALIVHGEAQNLDRHLGDVLNAVGLLWTTVSDRLGRLKPTDTGALPTEVGARRGPDGATRDGGAFCIVVGAGQSSALSVRVDRGWSAHPKWMGRLAQIADRFPMLTVSVPLSEDDDGTGSASTVCLTRICMDAGVDIERTGDFRLDREPALVPPMIVEPLAFLPDSLDFIVEHLATTP